MDLKSLLLEHYTPQRVEDILNIKSGGVTTEMLSEGQLKAFIAITKLIDNNFLPEKANKEGASLMEIMGAEKKHITLNGPAGTGKTTLMKFIVEYIKLAGYSEWLVPCAPSHSARKVLSSYTNLETYTIHKVLKIRPDNYKEVVTFSRSEDDSGVDLLKTCRILMVDEISFIDRDLFNILMNNLPKGCLIIGLGNMDQLKPIQVVKDGEAKFNEISPFFTDDRFYQIGLTEIKRSDSPVTLVGEAIRRERMEGGIPTRSYLDNNGDGVHVIARFEEFLEKYFEYVKNPEDLKNNRLVAYSNRDVDMLNDGVRRHLYGSDVDPYLKGEIIIAQKPCMERSLSVDANILVDNGAYLEIMDIQEGAEEIEFPVINKKLKVKKYELRVKELDVFFNDEVFQGGSKKIEYIDVIHPNYKHAYQTHLSDLRDTIIQKKLHRNWRHFYYFQDKVFADVKHLPACTIHKSQGITVDNLFYYVGSVAWISDRDLARRLNYVAITRSRYNTYIH